MLSLFQYRNFAPDRLGDDWVARLNDHPPHTAKVVSSLRNGFSATPVELLVALGDAATSGLATRTGGWPWFVRRLWPLLRYADLIAATNGVHRPPLALAPAAAPIRRRAKAALSEEFGVALATHMARARLHLAGELVDVDTADDDPIDARSAKLPDFLILDRNGAATAIIECKGTTGAPHKVVRGGLEQLAQVRPVTTPAPDCRRLVLGAEFDTRAAARRKVGADECPVNAVAAELDGAVPATDAFGRPKHWREAEADVSPRRLTIAESWSPSRTARRLLAWSGSADIRREIAGLPVVGHVSEVRDETGIHEVFVGLLEPTYESLRERAQLLGAEGPVGGAASLQTESFDVLSQARAAAEDAFPVPAPEPSVVSQDERVSSSNVVVDEGDVSSVVTRSGLALTVRRS